MRDIILEWTKGSKGLAALGILIFSVGLLFVSGSVGGALLFLGVAVVVCGIVDAIGKAG